MIKGWPWLLLILLLLLPLLGACGTRRFAAQGWSGLVLSEETLYVGTRDGRIIALNPENGAPMLPGLTYPDPFGQDDKLGGIYSSPVLVGDTLYVATYESRSEHCEGNRKQGKTPCGRLYGLPIRDSVGGSARLSAWSFPRFGQAGTGTLVGAPAVVEDTLLVGSSDGFLYAVNVQDGSLEWTFETGGKIWSSSTVRDGVVYIGSLDHTLYAVDLESGSEVWRFETGGAIAGRPLVEDGKVYVGSFDRTLYALDAATGVMLWEFKGDQWFWAGPASDGATIYAATLGGTLYALDPNTGQEKWREPATTRGAIVVPPLVLPEHVVVATDAGLLSVIQKADGLEEWGPDLGASVRAPLVAKGDIVYISDLKNTVRAINVKLKDLPGEGSDAPGVWQQLVMD